MGGDKISKLLDELFDEINKSTEGLKDGDTTVVTEVVKRDGKVIHTKETTTTIFKSVSTKTKGQEEKG